MAGCGFSGSENVNDEFQKRLNQAREVWNQQDINSYELTYERRRAGNPSVTVTTEVVNGSIQSAVTSSGESFPVEQALSVPRFFDVIEEAIQKDNRQFAADFNDEQGYPTNYIRNNDGTSEDDFIDTIRLEPTD